MEKHTHIYTASVFLDKLEFGMHIKSAVEFFIPLLRTNFVVKNNIYSACQIGKFDIFS
jgi:hypothetical protein